MTHPDPLTRAVQAALDAAAKTCDRLASDPTMYNADRRKAAGQCSAAIRAIDPAEVLAKVGADPVPDAVARLVEAARAGLNYLENTEGEFGITLGSATGLRAALAAMEAIPGDLCALKGGQK